MNPLAGMIRSLALAFSYETQSGLRIQYVDLLLLKDSIDWQDELVKLLKSWPKASEIALRMGGSMGLQRLECRLSASPWEDPGQQHLKISYSTRMPVELGEGTLVAGIIHGKNALAFLPRRLTQQTDISGILPVDIPSGMQPEKALAVVRSWLWPHVIDEVLKDVDRVCLPSSGPDWERKVLKLIERRHGSYTRSSDGADGSDCFILTKSEAVAQISLATHKPRLISRCVSSILDEADRLDALESLEQESCCITPHREEMLKLSGEATYVVAGGTRGLGLEMATYLAAHGGDVVALGRNVSAA